LDPVKKLLPTKEVVYNMYIRRGNNELRVGPVKAESNFSKHGVNFAEAEPVFEDDFALTITDDEADSDEQRFVSIGRGVKERVLAVVYCYRGSNIRIISARLAEARERAQYEEHR
jgi:uncharacterized DUF497 family protein